MAHFTIHPLSTFITTRTRKLAHRLAITLGLLGTIIRPTATRPPAPSSERGDCGTILECRASQTAGRLLKHDCQQWREAARGRGRDRRLLRPVATTAAAVAGDPEVPASPGPRLRQAGAAPRRRPHLTRQDIQTGQMDRRVRPTVYHRNRQHREVTSLLQLIFIISNFRKTYGTS